MNELTKRKDILDLTKQGLSTFYNIVQMARYRCLYVRNKELQNNNTNQLDQNRTQMIKYTCLASLCVFGLFAIGFSGIKNRE